MNTNTIRVRFLQDRIVDDARVGTPREERYRKGEIKELPAHSAIRWINRGIAEEVIAEVATKSQAAAEVKNKAGEPEVEKKTAGKNPTKAG